MRELLNCKGKFKVHQGEGQKLLNVKKEQLVTKCYTEPWNYWAVMNTVMNLQPP
jgi:hypothetical protein